MGDLRLRAAGVALVACALLTGCGGSAGTGGGNDSAGRYTAGPSDAAGSSDAAEPSGGQTRTATGTEEPYPGSSGKRRKQGVGWVSLYPVDSGSPTPEGSTPVAPTTGYSPTPEDSSSATLQAAPAYPSVLYLWFDALVDKDCPNVRTGEDGSEGTLVRGLHAVCPAVLPEGSADWGTGEAAYDELASAGGLPDGTCADRSAYQLLKTLVELHRTYPTADFYVEDADSGGLSCPDQT